MPLPKCNHTPVTRKNVFYVLILDAWPHFLFNTTKQQTQQVATDETLRMMASVNIEIETLHPYQQSYLQLPNLKFN